jgi:adenine-specific DNA glycosylase
VCSIVFNERSPALVGSVQRLLSHLLVIHALLKGSGGKAPLEAIWKAAYDLVAGTDRAGAFNQALIELGSTVCKPTNPACETYPLNKGCAAYQLSEVCLIGHIHMMGRGIFSSGHRERSWNARKRIQRLKISAQCASLSLMPRLRSRDVRSRLRKRRQEQNLAR